MEKFEEKNFIRTLFFLSLFIFCVSSAAEEPGQPDWLKRVEFSMQWETDLKPRLYLQTVQPLYQDASKENTFFIQPRISRQNNISTYNLGVGYRKLASENLLLGINLFGDFQEQYSHGRAGIGLEALGQVLEGRFNNYIGVTEQREVAQASASTTFERVANGIDYELGTAVPYVPWLKVYGSGFWYDFNNSSDKNGWRSRIEATLSDSLRMEFFAWDDNKGEHELGGRVRFNLAFSSLTEVVDAVRVSVEPFPEKDLRDAMLLPVERNHEVVVEKFIRSGGLTIEAGRS